MERDPDRSEAVIALWPTDFYAYIIAAADRGELTSDDIRTTVSERDFRAPDPQPRRERFYRERVGPLRWLRVVVQWEGLDGRVYNAIPAEQLPAKDRPQ